MEKLPVIVLSGFLGAGKTTLLQKLLSKQNSYKIALIVNDMSEINVDANLLGSGTAKIIRQEEHIIEMSNGCICCTLREDLLTEVRKIAEAQKFDYLIIESSGISEPMPVAATFHFRDENGKSLSDLTYIDNMLTVVDASQFLDQFSSNNYLNEAYMDIDPEDDRSIVHLLVDQIEFANTIVLNKIDLVKPEILDIIRAAIKGLNPEAILIETTFSNLSFDQVVSTKRFDLAKAEQYSLWAKELNGFHTPEVELYGVTSFVYKRRLPFHPERFFKFTESEWPGVLRAKGYFWLAGREDKCGELSQAGPFVKTNSAGNWWASIHKTEWPLSDEWAAWLSSLWDKTVGDRRQELVFIGIGMNIKKIINLLDECLINEEEQRMISTGQLLIDPFPSWNHS